MYLGLDLGTSGLKALLLDDNQQVVAVATAPLQVSRPAPGWSEQDPATWIDACGKVLEQLSSHLPAVKGIGIAGHMHGVVLLDKDGSVLRPCMLWNDTRAARQAKAIDSDSVFREISGTIVFPGFSAPKMAWVQDNEPAVWRQVSTVLFPKDYLAFWLTGILACEPSDAAGSALFDCQRGAWSDQLCAAAGLDRGLLPPLVPSDKPRGNVLAVIASEFGLPKECVVAGGAGDNASASLGIGAVSNGHGQVSLGTSGVLLTVNERWTPKAETAVHSFNHAVTGSFIQMGVTLTATDSLSWIAKTVGKKPAELAGAVDSRGVSLGNVLFMPYLAGERTPYNLEKPSGAFFGLGLNHDAVDLTQAVMEGVAFSIADCAKALDDAGARVEHLTAVGGGAQSTFWVQTIANVLEQPLRFNPQAEHAAALGAARLGMAAARGMAVRDMVASTPSVESETVEPQPAKYQAYRDAVGRYRELFARTKEV